MKLSIENYALKKIMDDETAFKMIKDAGFDCVDYSFYWIKGLLDDENCIENAKNLRKKLDEIGLECNQAHAPFDLKFGDTLDETNPVYIKLIRSLEFASILGAKCIIVHAIYNTEAEKEDIEEYLEYNYNFYKGLEKYCQKFNIKVAVENLFYWDKKRRRFTKQFKSPEMFMNFIKSLNSDCFVGCVDIGHAAVTGYDPDDFILSTDANYIKALHVQDGDYIDDCHTLPYLGKFDWDNITKALAKIGYNGELTFEIFKFLERLDIDLMPYALKLAERCGRKLINIVESYR